MDHYQQNLLSASTGLPVLGAVVTVKLTGTATLATLYQTNNIAGATYANPSTWDAHFAAYIPDGRYDISVLENGRTTTLNDVAIFDPQYLITVALNIDAVNAAGTNIAAILALGGSLASIATVAANIGPVTAAGANIAAIIGCNANLAAITAAPGYAATASAGAAAAITARDAAIAARDAAVLAANTGNLAFKQFEGPPLVTFDDPNGYDWFRAEPYLLRHFHFDYVARYAAAGLRDSPDPTLSDMRAFSETFLLSVSGESLSLGHASGLVSYGTSTISDMFGTAGLVKSSIVPDDSNDISSSVDPDLVGNRAALTPAIEKTYGVDADDWTSHGETPLTGCAQMIAQLLKDEDGIDFTAAGMRFLLADDGRNGGSIITEDETLTGLTAQRVYATMGQGAALYGALGKTITMPAQMIITGTNDNANDAANYPGGASTKWFYTRAQTVQAQRQAKARTLGVIGPAARLPLLIGQTATHTNPTYLATTPHVALDQLQLVLDHQEFLLGCIQYAVQNNVADVHMSGAGSKQMGAYFGWALKRLIFDGIRQTPLMPVFTAQGSHIIGTFPVKKGHKIAGGLTIADTTVLSNWGVAAVDAGGTPQALTNPRVVSRDRIVWDAPAAPANVWKFRSAYTGNTTKGWTNIAETRSDVALIFDPDYLRLPMYRWLPISEITLS